MSEAITLHSRIAQFFMDQLNLEIASPQTDLFEVGVLDSMAFVELLLYLEEGFGIDVSLNDVEIDNFRSIDKIAEFVVSSTQMKGASSGISEVLEEWS